MLIVQLFCEEIHLFQTRFILVLVKMSFLLGFLKFSMQIFVRHMLIGGSFYKPWVLRAGLQYVLYIVLIIEQNFPALYSGLRLISFSDDRCFEWICLVFPGTVKRFQRFFPLLAAGSSRSLYPLLPCFYCEI